MSAGTIERSIADLLIVVQTCGWFIKQKLSSSCICSLSRRPARLLALHHLSCLALKSPAIIDLGSLVRVDSDITKPYALTDNGILTHTDTVNKVGNDAIESESAKVTDSRKFQTRWEKLWPWVSYDKSTGKMYCEACIETLWTHKHQISQPLLSRLRVSQQWQYAKTIVKAARYPVNSMQGLWELLTKHHKEELPDLINLSQIALTLPLHTASCEGYSPNRDSSLPNKGVG